MDERQVRFCWNDSVCHHLINSSPLDICLKRILLELVGINLKL